MSEPTVTYTVKDKLDSIDRRLESVTDTVLHQLEKLGERVSTVETQLASKRHTSASWITTLTLMAVLISGIASMIIALRHG